MTESCDSCRYFGIMLNSAGAMLTICRRRSPVVHTHLLNGNYRETTPWPQVDRDRWCGDYREKRQ